MAFHRKRPIITERTDGSDWMTVGTKTVELMTYGIELDDKLLDDKVRY